LVITAPAQPDLVRLAGVDQPQGGHMTKVTFADRHPGTRSPEEAP
jgi:hypothetical protein